MLENGDGKSQQLSATEQSSFLLRSHKTFCDDLFTDDKRDATLEALGLNAASLEYVERSRLDYTSACVSCVVFLLSGCSFCHVRNFYFPTFDGR